MSGKIFNLLLIFILPFKLFAQDQTDLTSLHIFSKTHEPFQVRIDDYLFDFHDKEFHLKNIHEGIHSILIYRVTTPNFAMQGRWEDHVYKGFIRLAEEVDNSFEINLEEGRFFVLRENKYNNFPVSSESYANDDYDELLQIKWEKQQQLKGNVPFIHLSLLTPDSLKELRINLKFLNTDSEKIEVMQVAFLRHNYSTKTISQMMAWKFLENLKFEILKQAFDHVLDTENYKNLASLIDKEEDKIKFQKFLKSKLKF